MEQQNGFYRLSWLQRIGFGSGDLAQNLIYQTICMYLLLFYTNVYGLEPTQAAFMFLIVRVIDVLWDLTLDVQQLDQLEGCVDLLFVSGWLFYIATHNKFSFR